MPGLVVESHRSRVMISKAPMCFWDLVYAKKYLSCARGLLRNVLFYPLYWLALKSLEADYPVIRQFLAKPVRAGSY